MAKKILLQVIVCIRISPSHHTIFARNSSGNIDLAKLFPARVASNIERDLTERNILILLFSSILV